MKFCPVCQFESLVETHCPRDGTELQVKPVRDRLAGTVLKNAFRLEKKLAEGGMGSIYKATQLKGGPSVAVKILHPDSECLEEHSIRFMREAEILGQINHPNVVKLYDYGVTDQGLVFMVMEYLHGRTLDQVITARGKGIPVENTVAVLEESCHGVEAAHKIGLVHRDLKPDNIFVAKEKDGTAVVKVIDFGLAKPMEDERTALTLVGRVVGSAGFIAPEHILGSRDFQESSDIYALGAVLYFMLTGKKPYDGSDIKEIMTAQVHEKPPPMQLENEDVVEAFSPVVSKAMSRKPEKRYKSVPELLEAVEEALAWLEGEDTVVMDCRDYPFSE